MDNLVRAANGMPIIQVDYTRATGQVTIKNTIGGGDSQAVTASNIFAIPAASLMATRTIVTTLMGSLSNESSNQVTIEAVPLITNNEVYDAYLEYLSLPGSLRVSCDPPAPGTFHLSRKYDGKYFWVPLEYRGAFFKLSLLTTAQRGKRLLPPPESFPVKVVGQRPDVPAEGALGTRRLIITLDQKLPSNDLAFLVLDKDKTQQILLTPAGGAEPIEVSAPTNEFKVAVPGDRPSPFENADREQPTGQVFMLQHRPGQPTTEDLINRVNFQLQQIQFNQLRQPSL
jgi:hypothetical protein